MQIHVASVLQVFGCKAIVFNPKERRQGAEQETTRKCLYLGMATEVANGYKLLQYDVTENGMLEFIGDIFEERSGRVTCYPDQFPMREARGPRATAKQLEEDLEKADPGVSGVMLSKPSHSLKLWMGRNGSRYTGRGTPSRSPHGSQWSILWSGGPVPWWLNSGLPRKPTW